MNIFRAPPRKTPSQKAKEHLLHLEHLILKTFVALICCCFIFMLVATLTDWWVILKIKVPVKINSTHYFAGSHSGLWRYCQFIYVNESAPLISQTSSSFFKNYSRAEGIFSGITLFLMILAQMFALWALHEARFMYKRLAGLIILFSGASAFVTMEMVISTHLFEEKNLPPTHASNTQFSYGYSFALCAMSFVAYVLSGTVFLLYSAKRKEEWALTSEEAVANRPFLIRR